MSDAMPETRYRDLLDEALARIPALAPEWTDHNPGDPGIALLELIAWLTETVLYRTTRLTDGERQAFLALIEGLDPQSTLRGQALDRSTSAAIKGLRAPHRLVTRDDYLDRLRAEFPRSREARALGMDGRVARLDLFSGDAQQALGHAGQLSAAQRAAGVTITALPDDLCWAWDGTLTCNRRRGFFRQTIPGHFGIWNGRDVDTLDATVRTEANNGAIIAHFPGWGNQQGFVVERHHLGHSGELSVAPLSNAAGDIVNWDGEPYTRPLRNTSSSMASLISTRWVTIRRPGVLLAVVTTPSDLELRLQLRDPARESQGDVRGRGMSTYRRVFTAADLADGPHAWELRLFVDALEKQGDTPVPLQWRTLFCETAIPWEAETGGDPLNEAIWQWVEPRRLLGTRHDVAGYRWAEFGLRATLFLADGWSEEAVRQNVVDALWRAYAPPPVGPQRRAGQPVYHSRVIACLEEVEGVDYVKGVQLLGANALEEGGARYGLALAPDQLPALDFARCSFTFYERS